MQNSNSESCHQIVWIPLKTLKEGLNNTANTKEGTEEQTWRRLERMANAVFENIFTLQFFKLYPVVCNVWYNALGNIFVSYETSYEFVIYKHLH